jgi:predicted methyltransferase
MPNRSLPRWLIAALFVLSAHGLSQAATAADPALAAAVGSSQRSQAFIARDKARHPVEELSFFGLRPDQTVIEIWPGGGYWTEILGPYLAQHGHYYVALPPGGNDEEGRDAAYFHSHFGGKPQQYGQIGETVLGHNRYDIGPPASADLVLTFRNLHNWMYSGYAQQALEGCFRALKPGGILGIEEHRGRKDQPQDPQAKNGYVREDYTIALAKRVGFELVGSSEINANTHDTKDWVDGVWTLPPTLSQGEKDRARYLAVGEADNFVLKFRKPAR